jgi:hypothetical protein
MEEAQMRLVTFAVAGAKRIGALADGDRRIVDFLAARSDAGPAFSSMQALIEAGPAALDRAREIAADAQRSGRGMIDAASVKLLTIARLPLFREAFDPGVHPHQSDARRRGPRPGKGATRA